MARLTSLSATCRRAAFVLAFVLACVVASGTPLRALDPCGGPSDACRIDAGSYHLRLPPQPEGAPVIVYLHGYGGSGAGSVKPGMLADRAAARGFVFVAPNAVPRPGGTAAAWAVNNGLEPHRDELGFLDAVIDDVIARTGADRSRLFLTGFSLGGSMVWNVACRSPAAYIGFAPVAGAFWQPLPERCASPVRLFHTHGTADRTVPIEGRAVMNGRIRQGDLYQGLEILRRTNGCPQAGPTAEPDSGGGVLRIAHWEGCAPGSELTLALHDGAHGLPRGWFNRTLDWFAALSRQGGER